LPKHELIRADLLTASEEIALIRHRLEPCPNDSRLKVDCRRRLVHSLGDTQTHCQLKGQQPMQRPTSVTVFGILNIVFAAFGIFGLIASIALFFMPGNSNNPVIKIMNENAAYAMWLKVCIPLGVLSCAALLAAGIGLLRLKSWARKLSIGYAIYAIVFGIIGMVVNFIFLIEPMLKEAQNQQGPEAAGAIGGAIGGSFGGCFGMIYPVLLLIFMMRPTVVAAFQPSAPPQT
jgi:hypothetical protein